MTTEPQDQTLKESMDEAEWTWIKPHSTRDAVIVVHESLDLLEAAVSMAKNQHQTIQAWISKGLLTKPSAQQIKVWDEAPSKRFLTLIVQPFVLIQELRTESLH